MRRFARRTPASSSVCCHILFNLHFVSDLGTGEVGKILGEKWKELSEKEKKPYEDRAKKDKERYENEKAQYAAVSL